MKPSIYLAGRYSTRDTLKNHATVLKAEGFEVTSRWLNEKHHPQITLAECSVDFLRRTAKKDLEDIQRADLTVVFTVDPETPTKRGGRHVETGYALAVGGNKSLVVCGPRENIFHFLPGVRQFNDFPSLVKWLTNTYE